MKTAVPTDGALTKKKFEIPSVILFTNCAGSLPAALAKVGVTKTEVPTAVP